MSEKHLKLKLKRKKVAIQGDKCEPSLSAVKKSSGAPIPFSSNEKDRHSEATKDPYDSKPVEWWEKPDLQGVEKLWAVTLKAAFADVGHNVWETVPDLPLASPLKRSVEEQIGWTWCDLSEEVGPLPTPTKPSASCSGVPDAPGPDARLSSADSGPGSGGIAVLPNPARLSPAPVPGEATEGMSAPRPRGRTELQAPSPPPTREVPPGVAGRSGGAREENWAEEGASSAGSRGAEGGGAKWRLPVCAGDGSDRGAPGEQHECTRPPLEEGGAFDNSGTHRPSAGATAAATMENCPMCLLPFPSGFTQLECDSHLAKCLSEMSEDIAW